MKEQKKLMFLFYFFLNIVFQFILTIFKSKCWIKFIWNKKTIFKSSPCDNFRWMYCLHCNFFYCLSPFFCFSFFFHLPFFLFSLYRCGWGGGGGWLFAVNEFAVILFMKSFAKNQKMWWHYKQWYSICCLEIKISKI